MKLSKLVYLMTVLPLLANCGVGNDNKSDTKGVSEIPKDRQYDTDTAQLHQELDASFDKREAAFVFYVVDTEEPKMQGALAHELRALKEACSSSKKMNWVLYANSHYAVQKKYVRCVAGQLAALPLNLPELDAKVAAYSRSDFDNSLTKLSEEQKKLFRPELKVAHESKANLGYVKMPFAHPEALRSILKHAYNDVFPIQKYVHFVTTKSHGGNGFVVAGLTGEQLSAKIQDQTALLINNASTKMFHEEVKYGYAGFNVSKSVATRLTAMRLGQIKARRPSRAAMIQAIIKDPGSHKRSSVLNADDGFLNADDSYLNAEDGYLNADDGFLNADDGFLNADDGFLNAEDSKVDGLSAGNPNEGLGIEATYGMTLDNYAQAIKIAGIEASKKAGQDVVVGMLMIEACETNVFQMDRTKEPYLKIANALAKEGGGVKAMYSAKGFMQYRNFDWNNFLMDWAAAGGSSSSAQKRLMEEVKKVRVLVKK